MDLSSFHSTVILSVFLDYVQSEATKKGPYFTLSSSHRGQDPKNQLDVSDVECPLCLRIFWEPVTTPCGHSFCRACLYQALDTSPSCPLCKGSLEMVNVCVFTDLVCYHLFTFEFIYLHAGVV